MNQNISRDQPLDDVNNRRVRATRASALNPHEQGLLDVGKKMLTDSLSVSVDFCKSMIATSTGAIAVYYALFTYILPKDYRPATAAEATLIALPGIAFLVAAGLFAWGYYPHRRNMSLQMIERPPTPPEGSTARDVSIEDVSIESAYKAALDHRRSKATWGTLSFLAGLALSIYGVTTVAQARTPTTPATTKVQITQKAGAVTCGEPVTGAPQGSIFVKPSKESVPMSAIRLDDIQKMDILATCP